MRTIFVSSLVAVVATLAAPAITAGAQRPSVRFVARDPITVRASGFHARERVRVTLTAPERRVRLVRTTAAGRFTVVFASVSYDRCTEGLAVMARGARGGVATAKLPQPQCAPA